MNDIAQEWRTLQLYAKRKVAHGLGDTRRWSAFVERFNIPSSWASLERRVYTNALYYTSNYIIIAALILIWSMLTNWRLLISATLIILQFAYIYGVKQGDIVVARRPTSPSELGSALAASTFIILWVTGTILAALLATAIIVAVVFLHAALRPPNTASSVNKFATDIGVKMSGNWTGSSDNGVSSGGRRKRGGTGGSRDADASGTDEDAGSGSHGHSSSSPRPASISSVKDVVMALLGNPQPAGGSNVPAFAASAGAVALPSAQRSRGREDGSLKRSGSGIEGAASDVEGPATSPIPSSSIPAFANTSVSGLTPLPPFPGAPAASTVGAVTSPFSHDGVIGPAMPGSATSSVGGSQWHDVGFDAAAASSSAISGGSQGQAAAGLVHRRGGGPGVVDAAALPRPH